MAYRNTLILLLLSAQIACGQFLINSYSVEAAGGAGFTPEAAGFTGEDLTVGTYVGANDSSTFTVAFWVDFAAGDGSVVHLLWESGNSFEIFKNASNQMQVMGESIGGTDILDANSSVTQVEADGWTHWLIVGNGSAVKFYKNGTLDGSSTTTLYTGADIDFNVIQTRISGGNSAIGALTGNLSEFLFDDAANDVIGDYYSSGNPVDLIGLPSVFYLSQNGSGDSWAVDSSGNGNTFTVNGGTLTSPTPPP